MVAILSSNQLPWYFSLLYASSVDRDQAHGGRARSQWQLQSFCTVIDRCALMDLGYQGFPFTWSNQRDGSANIQERLDRALVTKEWLSVFPRATLSHFSVIGSNHYALLLTLVPERRARKRQFHFDARWTLSDDSRQIIDSAWSTPIRGSVQFQWAQKLWHCKADLIHWAKLRNLNS
ncbi:uncharacterized protein LOC132272834 [Cornus florida]|uniref:uncharacterized protein LOC132272834 n=1 Tax=Cornus florida TaxID=4283 RepID=UPI0028985E24|nr:uncharacterized protein LOC132272834 [Cornus florida]